MIGLEDLDALDLMIWLGRGADAAARLGCNQSTISRRTTHCLQVFELNLRRDAEGLPDTGEPELLALEREVHQRHRLRHAKRQPRLEASLLAAPLLQGAIPDGWMAGTLDGLGSERPLRLLRSRILDAWITGMAQDLSDRQRQDLRCFPLLLTPLQLAGASGHPLIGTTGLQLADVAGMPRLAPRQGLYPRTERLLGDWRRQHPPLPLQRNRRRSIGTLKPGMPQLLHYGTRFSLAHQSRLQALMLDLGVQTQLSLIVRRDVAEEPSLARLIDALQRRARQAALAEQGVAL